MKSARKSKHTKFGTICPCGPEKKWQRRDLRCFSWTHPGYPCQMCQRWNVRMKTVKR